MLLLALVTIVDILGRSLIGQSLGGSNEIVEAAMAVSIGACLAVGIAARGHLRINVLRDLMPPAVAGWLDVLASFSLSVLFGLLAKQFTIQAGISLGRDQASTILDIPLAPVQYAVAVMVAFCALLAFLKLAQDMRRALGLDESGSGRTWLLTLVNLLAAALIVFLVLGPVEIPSNAGAAVPVTIAILVGAVLLSVPISAALACAAVVGLGMMLGYDSAVSILGDESFSYLTNSGLIVLPFFLLMGAFAGLSGMASDIYRLAFELLRPIRGGLAHATILGSAGFGALTGSSLATAATFGKIALPEMEKRSYSPALASGTIAAGGTLGALIPPSVPLIIYGILVQVSIGKLLLAAFIPAFIGVMLYLATIFIMVRVRGDAAPGRESVDWAAVRESAKGCWAALLLFAIIWGGLYFGFFTDSEAASVGAVGTFAFAVIRGKLRLERLAGVMGEVSNTLAMIFPLIFGAVTVSYFVAFTQLPQSFADVLLASDLTPVAIIVLLVLSYVVMGMVMDSFAIMFITAPIYATIIASLGYDPIWWGIVTVVCVEIGVISPPFGMNLFVLHGVAPHLRLATIYRGILPFFASDIVKVVLLLAMPWLVIY
jgi:tripartite ATP-independent transporter DctM subunit